MDEIKGIVVTAAGDYRVSFAYRPRGFTASLLASAGGFLLFAGIIVAVRRPPA